MGSGRYGNRALHPAHEDQEIEGEGREKGSLVEGDSTISYVSRITFLHA
jgi:hypothetical protein